MKVQFADRVATLRGKKLRRRLPESEKWKPKVYT
jgi:hypothetical protein